MANSSPTEPLLMRIAYSTLTAISWMFDIFTFVPSYVYWYSSQRFEKRLKAKPDNGHPGSNWKFVNSSLIESLDPNCKTLDTEFARASKLYQNEDCLGTQESLAEDEETQANGKKSKKLIMGKYKWKTYRQTFLEADNFGKGLHELGVQPRQNVLIFSETREEYFISLQACFRYNHPDSVKHLWDTMLACDFHFHVSVVYTGLVLTILFLSVSGTNLCPNNQTAELGEPGHIHCNFIPEEVNDVYWFDNISDSSPHSIRYKTSEGVKSGPGFDSGEYDVQEDGSLVITNVTTWHQRMYKVFVFTLGLLTPDTLFTSLKVVASPIDEYPVIVCHNCHQEHYISVMEGETPRCSFNATRPPVQLEWFEHFDDGYDHVEIQQFNITENRNGTYNTQATLHSLKDSSNLIHLLVCRATWPLSDWRREKEMFLDFSSSMSFSDVTPKIQYMVVNTHAVIMCGGSSSVYVVWKRILTNSEPEIIGFHSHVRTETISSIPDVEVSAEGNLIFSSPQVHHEGSYACIYGDGQKEEIQMTSVELLIPPSPPYIQITGCDDVSHSCVVKEESTKKLACAVHGFRPTASLEWIAEDTDQITFFNHKEVIKESSETTDIIISVEYKVSQDVLCGEEVLIRCHLYGPLTKIMKEESTAIIVPASCKEHGENREHGLGGGVIALMAVVCTPLFVMAVSIFIYCIYRYQTKSTTAKPAYYGVSIDDLQDASLQTGNGKPAGKRPNGSSLHHVEDASLQIGNGNPAGHRPNGLPLHHVEDKYA